MGKTVCSGIDDSVPFKRHTVDLAPDRVAPSLTTLNHNHVLQAVWSEANFLSFWPAVRPTCAPDRVPPRLTTLNHNHVLQAVWSEATTSNDARYFHPAVPAHAAKFQSLPATTLRLPWGFPAGSAVEFSRELHKYHGLMQQKVFSSRLPAASFPPRPQSAAQ